MDKIAVITREKDHIVVAIGEGINAIGYRADLAVTGGLPEENREFLHILDTEVSEDTIAPKEVWGSVLHNLDYQRMLLADFYARKLNKPWSLENRMILMPIERLFFRKKIIDTSI